MDMIMVCSPDLLGVGSINLRSVVGGHVLALHGDDCVEISSPRKGELQIKPVEGGTIKVLDIGGFALGDGQSTILYKGDAIRIHSTRQLGLHIRVVHSVVEFT